jgi:uncharacterized protein (DUF1778 family)
MPSTAPKKRGTLNLRIRPEDRGLIDRAARVAGESRTDFMVGASRRAAEDALLDRVLFRVSHSVYDDFLRKLDAPPAPNARLRKSLQSPPPWEK